jgi:hypothetical protein
VQLTAADIAELTAVLPLSLELEPYRERLSPLAVAVLGGESRRTIEKRREGVLSGVWDPPLRQAAVTGIGELRKELERKLQLLELALADLDQPARKSRLARHVVDRVLAELLDNHDENIAALEQIERELEALAPDERTSRAAIAARGAYVAARIPRNEFRAALVRTARAVQSHGLERDDAADHGARLMARTLATDERRAAVRTWARMLGEASAEHVPLLAEELQALAAESAAGEAGSDLIWIQACLGMTMEAGLALS